MKKLLLLSVALALSGCATQRFDVQPSDQAIPSLDESHSFFVAGVGQNKEVDAAKVCGGASKVQRVETQLTPGNIALGLVTLGIYTPRQIRVYCTR